MTIDKILNYCINNLKDVILLESWGEKGIYYNPGKVLKRGVYILTIKEKDGENDRSSNLNRDNIFRVNIGIRKETFKNLFGPLPMRPLAGQTIDANFDFKILDKIIPHPVYAWMAWVSILNPSNKTFLDLEPLIKESYEYAIEKFNKTHKKREKIK